MGGCPFGRKRRELSVVDHFYRAFRPPRPHFIAEGAAHDARLINVYELRDSMLQEGFRAHVGAFHRRVERVKLDHDENGYSARNHWRLGG